jgi:hypothetical protein
MLFDTHLFPLVRFINISFILHNFPTIGTSYYARHTYCSVSAFCMVYTSCINLNSNLNSCNTSELSRTICQARQNYLSVPIFSWRKLEQRISRIVINSEWQTRGRGQFQKSEYKKKKIVVYLSILEFDISSIRSFLKRGKRLYNAMHFHNVSLGFFLWLYL